MRTMLLPVVIVLAIGATAGCEARPDRVVFGIGMTRDIHPAVVQAAREINSGGGIGGVPLELDGLDSYGMQSGFDSGLVLGLANRFVANPQLLAVVGHSDSASTLSAAAVYNAHEVPQVVTIATNPAITGIGRWTYRLCLSDSAQGPALADYAVKTWKKRRVAIIFVYDAYGSGLAEQFEGRVRELGADIVATVMHRNLLQPDDQETIRLALARMKTGTPPDLIVLFQRVQAAQWTVSAIRDAGLDADILGGDNLAQQAFAKTAGGLAEGVRVSQFAQFDTAVPGVARFRDAYRTSVGSEPDYSQAFAYDAIYLLRDAVLSGGYTRAGVKAYLDRLIAERRTVAGVGGTFTLGADHDARRALHIAEIRGGAFVAIGSLAVK